MTLDPNGLSRPEAFADRVFKKRYVAAMKREGLCSFCTLREVSFGVAHCKGQPERQHGLCVQDKKLPQFRLDDTTLERLRHGR